LTQINSNDRENAMTDKPAKPAKAAKPDNIKAESPALTDKVATDAAAAAANALSVAITKADAVVVSSLSSRVTALEGTITSQGSSITRLNSSVTSQGQSITSLDAPVFSTVGALTTVLNTKIVEPGGLALSPAVVAVLAERARQLQEEGHTAEADAACQNGELVKAAICYAMAPAQLPIHRAMFSWPFSPASWKPTEPTRDLVKAAALLLAELERRYRLAEASESESV
jgi:uncharacterized coiled-coil protein SlyX